MFNRYTTCDMSADFCAALPRSKDISACRERTCPKVDLTRYESPPLFYRRVEEMRDIEGDDDEQQASCRERQAQEEGSYATRIGYILAVRRHAGFLWRCMWKVGSEARLDIAMMAHVLIRGGSKSSGISPPLGGSQDLHVEPSWHGGRLNK